MAWFGHGRPEREATGCWWASSCKVIRAMIGRERQGCCLKDSILGAYLVPSRDFPPTSTAEPQPPPSHSEDEVAARGRAGSARRLALPNLTAVGKASFHSALHEQMPAHDRSARTCLPAVSLLPARREAALNLPCASARTPAHTLPLSSTHTPTPTPHTRRWQTGGTRTRGAGVELRSFGSWLISPNEQSDSLLNKTDWFPCLCGSRGFGSVPYHH